ncbi:hypothetical protein Glove_5g79 [Diversispora epigaea]|uniref:Uncharacterized protein n=1 Tax=Diversispora epigaea TaxID=1348612 RepID=A0A397JS07_9GLOM|nr:hypothetical protein Glove_5g79 [Diversispora epigaea]
MEIIKYFALEEGNKLVALGTNYQVDLFVPARGQTGADNEDNRADIVKTCQDKNC